VLVAAVLLDAQRTIERIDRERRERALVADERGDTPVAGRGEADLGLECRYRGHVRAIVREGEAQRHRLAERQLRAVSQIRHAHHVLLADQRRARSARRAHGAPIDPERLAVVLG
jgi:hypothetical protein